MTVRITPVSVAAPNPTPVEIILPPDKSILHRILFIGSLTQSAITIPIPGVEAISQDVIATVLALESLGVPVELFEDRIELQGVGRHGYRMPTHVINCANSGTTARFLMGLLAGQQFNSALTGDASLSARPMLRLVEVLENFGATLVTTPEGTLPVMIQGKPFLLGARIDLAIASAQMKSAVLLAGLYAAHDTVLTEPSQSRDHTERMLAAFGFEIDIDEEISLNPDTAPDIEDEFEYAVPGDTSSAAFLIVAAILLRRRITLLGVGLNPTRTRFLDVLAIMGVEMEALNVIDRHGEPRGDLTIFGDRISEPLTPFSLEEEDIPLLIDELPVLFILGIFADGESEVTGASELRKKESDRIGKSAEQLRRFGVDVMELDDGIRIVGVPRRTLNACSIDHNGDHRLAMSFTIASLFCNDDVTIDEAEAVAVSYPNFYEHLRSLCGPDHLEILLA